MGLITAAPRRFRRGLIAIVGVAAAVRVTVFIAVYHDRPLGFNDAEYYSRQASALIRGHWFIDPTTGGPGAEHGPLTTVLVAPVSWMARPENWQRFVTVITGIICVAVIGLAARALASRREAADPSVVGLVAAGIAAVYPNLWLNDGLVMSEGLAALLVSIWILAGLAVADGESPVVRDVVVLGVIGGLAALSRSELILLVPFAAVLIWRASGPKRLVRIGVLAGVTALTLAPWVVPNVFRFERPVLLTTNDGGTLRGSNCDRTYGGPEMGSWSIFCLVIDPSVVEMETSRRSDRWRSDASSYAREHAGRVPLVVVARIGRTLDVFRLTYQINEDVRDGRPRWGTIAGIGFFWVLAPLAAFGLRRRGSPSMLVLWAPVAVVAFSTVVFYGGHRIRAPLEPVVVIGAALTIGHLVSRLAQRGVQPVGD